MNRTTRAQAPPSFASAHLAAPDAPAARARAGHAPSPLAVSLALYSLIKDSPSTRGRVSLSAVRAAWPRTGMPSAALQALLAGVCNSEDFCLIVDADTVCIEASGFERRRLSPECRQDVKALAEAYRDVMAFRRFGLRAH